MMGSLRSGLRLRSRVVLSALLSAALLGVACSSLGEEPTPTPTPLEPTPTPTATPVPYTGPVTTQAEYLQACEAELGPFPTFNCYDGTLLPITVTDADGTREVTDRSQLEDNLRCDKPSRLSGCVPYSYVGLHENARGSVFTTICRLYEFREPVGTLEDGRPRVLFEDLGVIGHNPTTGATCFWAVPIDGKLFDGTVIPRPGTPEDENFFPERPFWYTLPDQAGSGCMSCHDNDPYIHDPWVNQADVVPYHAKTDYHAVAADELNALANVSDWSPARYLKHPDAAPCLQCHRLADRFTCGTLAQDATGQKSLAMPTSAHYSQYPYSHWMDNFDPAVLAAVYPTQSDWDARFSKAVSTVESCCRTKNSKDCWQ